MRIGYIVPEFPSQTHAFFWREVRALREEGHHVDLLSTTAPPTEACRHAFAEQARQETVYLNPPRATEVISALAAIRPQQAWSVSRYVVRCRPRSPQELAKLAGIGLCAIVLTSLARRRHWDHVHVHSCADAAHLGAMARLLGGPPYSLTLHGDLEVYGRNHAIKMAGAEFVSTVTRPLRDQVLAETGLRPGQVPVICMGVDVGRFAPLSRSEGRRPDDASIRLLTVARLNYAKGHVVALRAIRSVVDRGVDLRYTIAGTGDEQEAIVAEIERLGLGGRVDLVGTLSEAEVLDALLASDIFLLSSFGAGEAAPVAVMEAMSCEVPVIASIIGGTPDMITDGVDGLLVPQRDDNAIAEGIERLARSPETRRRLGRAARGTAVGKFDYRVNACLLVSEMAGSAERGAPGMSDPDPDLRTTVPPRQQPCPSGAPPANERGRS